MDVLTPGVRSSMKESMSKGRRRGVAAVVMMSWLGCTPGSPALPSGESSTTSAHESSGPLSPSESSTTTSDASSTTTSTSDEGSSTGTGHGAASSTGDPEPPPACGDGVQDLGEECDEGEANDPSGTCLPGCTLAQCGDGEILLGVETCDTTNLGEQSCRALGFDGGELGCDEACTIDSSGCHTCGDGMAGGPETCDGEALGDATCESVLGPGFHGTLACDAACGFDTSQCFECGDGVIDPGETCDGAELDGEDCASLLGLQFHGTLACDAACGGFDLAQCYECGDGVIDPGESCDGIVLGGETCTSQGMDGGTLACSWSCDFNLSGCDVCGNGIREADEACDGNDFAGQSCGTLGPNDPGMLGGGDLLCNADCTVDTSGCSTCGNGVLEAGEECDTNDFGGQSCADLYGWRIAGSPLCTSICMLHPSYGCCIPTGNQCAPGQSQCCGGPGSCDFYSWPMICL